VSLVVEEESMVETVPAVAAVAVAVAVEEEEEEALLQPTMDELPRAASPFPSTQITTIHNS
jgi:hypothetical protein